MQGGTFFPRCLLQTNKQIIPSCVNSNGARTATATWSASTAKSGITSLHFKKAINLALVLNFTERQRDSKSWMRLSCKDTQKLTALTALLQRHGPVEQLVCLCAELGNQQPALAQILQTLTAPFRCIPWTVCTNAGTTALYQTETCSLCVHLSVHNCKSWSHIQ